MLPSIFFTSHHRPSPLMDGSNNHLFSNCLNSISLQLSPWFRGSTPKGGGSRTRPVDIASAPKGRGSKKLSRSLFFCVLIYYKTVSILRPSRTVLALRFREVLTGGTRCYNCKKSSGRIRLLSLTRPLHSPWKSSTTRKR